MDFKSVSMVEEFRVLAVQAEPPEIAPGEGTALRVLWADPLGQEREVSFAWMGCSGLVHPSEGIATCDMIVPPQVATAADGGDVLEIPATPPDLLERAPGAESLHLTFIAIMCAGGVLPAPRAYDGLRETEYIDTLCRGGDGLSAFKSVTVSREERRQTNPRISGFSLSDHPLAPADTGAIGRLTCRKQKGCDIEAPAVLDVDRASFQTFEVIEFGEPVAAEELLFVSWYVTGGDFEASRSLPSVPYGPFESTWRPEAPGTYTLYAVVHDTRGGAGWQTYTVAVSAP